MNARKAKRQPKAPVQRSHRESLQEASDGLLDLQRRLYVAKSQMRGAHALAQHDGERFDIEGVLREGADELESIANDMGNYLPLWLPQEGAK